MPSRLMQMNSATLVGRAQQDPEVRYYESGSVRATFILLVNHRNQQEPPDQFPLEFWGKQAQVVADSVRKDTLIGIIGSIKRDEVGQTYVRVDRLEILGPARS